MPKGEAYGHAIVAVSGRYLKAEKVGLSQWKVSPSLPPKAELYMNMPVVTGRVGNDEIEH